MSQLDLHLNETILWPFQKLQALQSHNVMKSNLGSLRDEEPEERLRQAQELWALKEKMEIQVSQGPMLSSWTRQEMCCLTAEFLLFTLVLGRLLFFSPLVVSDSLWPHGLQHARLPCPSSHRVHSNSCPLSWWCHPAISSFVAPFSSFPSMRVFSS